MIPGTLSMRWLRRAIVVLLQVDRPVPVRSEDEIAAEVERNYRWNFTVNVLDNTCYWFGSSFISASTILPLFISKLTTSTWPLGLLALIAQGAWFVPQVFTANTVERLARKKPLVINLGFFLDRLPMWLMVGAALLAVRLPLVALLVFFLGYAWRGIGSGITATAWQDMIARCFPLDRRGRFWGTASFTGAVMGVAGAMLSTLVLKTFDFPAEFVWLFAIATLGLMGSWFFLGRTREPAQAVDGPHQSNRQFLVKLPAILAQDRNFRRFLVARSLMALGTMGTGFVTVAVVRRWQVPDGTVGLYTAAYWLGQMIGNPAFGFLADRHGHKLSLELGGLASALAFAVAWLAPGPGWIYLVFVLLGITFSATLVSGILVALEFSEPQRRPTYAGMANTAAGLASMAAPLLGAWLAGLGYAWLFAVSALVNVAAYATMWLWVRDPRWIRTADRQD
jgi:MFS family permease